MEILINDDLNLSSSNAEANNESDNETDIGSDREPND